MRIEHLYRYPVKGLTPEALDTVAVETGEMLPWDRAFALAQGDSRFDPEQPDWVPKTNFLCLMANARAAALCARFDPARRILVLHAPDGAAIEADLRTAEGRDRAAAFLTAFLGPEARGQPRFHHIPGHAFSDVKQKVLSLINEASLRALEARVGAPRHRLRFRANVYFSGAPAWSEFDWIGRSLQLGSARLRVVKRIVRCKATEVNPQTAERDAETVAELRREFGHTDMGIYAEVTDGGRLAVGDGMELLPE